MKNLVHLVTVAFLMTAAVGPSIAGGNTGTEDLKTSVLFSRTGKINIYVDKANGDHPTSVVIRNGDGKIVYSEIVKRSEQKFGRILNVNDLSLGNYQIEVFTRSEKWTKTFVISEQKVERTVVFN